MSYQPKPSEVRIEVVGGPMDMVWVERENVQAMESADPGTFYEIEGKNYIYIGGKFIAEKA